MQTRIVKWGNSLGLRIPKAFALQAHVEEGSTVDLAIDDGNLVVRPLRDVADDLQALVDAITPDNMHEPLETGPPTGKEGW